MSTPRKLDDWIDSFLYLDHESESPEIFRKWAAVSTIAATAQRRLYLQHGPETLFTNFYIVLVGVPATRKGTALWIMKSLIDDLEIPKAAKRITPEALIKSMEEATNTIPVADGTMASQTALTAISEELAVFLGYNRVEFLADLCDWFDCSKSWVYDTKTKGKNVLPGVWFNLFGCTTPQQIRSILPPDHIGSGLTSRIIFVYAGRKAKRSPLISFPSTKEGQKLYDDLLHDLGVILRLYGRFRYTKECLNKYIEWYGSMPDTCPFDPVNFDYYWARRQTHLRKLLMIMALSRKETDGRKMKSGEMLLALTAEDFDKALAFIEEAEAQMPRAFEYTGQSEAAASIRDLLTYIANRASNGEYILLTDLTRQFIQDFDPDKFAKILNSLVRAGLIEVKDQKIYFIGGDTC